MLRDKSNSQTIEEWIRLQKVFEKCLQVSECERDGLLQEACGGDHEFRAEVQALLKSYLASEEDLENSPVGPTPDTPNGALPKVDGYEVHRAIHEGGQGAVFEAFQLGTKRRVALKFMLAGGLAGDANKRRFEREVELVGQLQHPGLVSVFDSGLANGQYFYAMEYVDGLRLKEFVRSRDLTLRQTLQLFIDVCSAVNFAQQHGVIHRDLKPSNILVDDRGQPRIVDFGLAKSLVPSAEAKQTVSLTGQVMGTLAYMSPEQASGKPDEIDTRTDVYSLGVVLFELLTEEMPYSLDLSLADNLSAIKNTGPNRLALRRHRIDNELETIVTKALKKEKDRRYQSAGELGEDLARYLRGEPIEAKRDSALYVTRKLLRRNLKTAIVGIMFLSLLVLTSIVSLLMYWDASQARDKASQSARLFEFQRDEMQELRDEKTAQLYNAEMNLAGQALNQVGGIGRVQGIVAKWRALESEKDYRGWEWYYLQSLCDREAATLMHGEAIWDLDWHPSKDLIVFSDQAGSVWLWDMKSEPRRIATVSQIPRTVRFNVDGSLIAIAGPHIQTRILDAQTEEEIHLLPRDIQVTALEWHPVKRHRFAMAVADGPIQIRDSDGEEMVEEIPSKHHVHCLAWADDGNRLLFGMGQETLVWHASKNEVQDRFQDTLHSISSIDWQPGNSRFAISDSGGGVTLFRPGVRKPVWEKRTQRLNTAVRWGQRKNQFATVGEDRVLRIWDLEAKGQVARYDGHKDDIWAMDWSPDGTAIATGSHDKTLKIWNTDAVNENRVIRLQPRFVSSVVSSVRWNPDGRLIALSGQAYETFLMDSQTGEILHQLKGRKSAAVDGAWSPDGNFIAVGGHDAIVTIFDCARKTVVSRFLAHDRVIRTKEDNIIHSVRWSPDGRFVVSCSQDGSVYVWEAMSGEVVAEHKEDWLVYSVDWHPQEDVIAIGCNNSESAKLWRFRSGQSPTELAKFSDAVSEVRWSPDGDVLAAASRDGMIKLIDWKSQETLRVLNDHTGAVNSIDWHPEGGRLASVSRDLTLKIWDVDSGDQTLSIKAHEQPVLTVQWSPDGRKIATGASDSLIKIWDASKGYQDSVGHAKRSQLSLPGR